MNFIEVPERDIREQAERFVYDTVEPRGEVNLILDGKKHRIALDGDRGNETSGLYCFYTDNCPAGYVRDFRNDLYSEWRFDFQALKDSQPNIYQQSQTKEFKIAAKRKQKERKERELNEKRDALSNIKAEIKSSQPATDEHGYLKRKQIKNHGFNLDSQGNLLIPLSDVDGKLKSLQRITPAGDKLFEANFETSEAFYVIGGHTLQRKDNFVICEGIATAASIYEDIEATQPEALLNTKIIAALNCGNLFRVCEAVKNKFKPKCLLIAADDDSRSLKHQDKGDNPGVDAALKCVKSEKADGYVIPAFDEFDDDDEAKEPTDFNDFAMRHESGEIAKIILEGLVKYTPKPWIMSIQELMDNFTPTGWLIEDWLPEQSQTLFFGASGTGKSFIAVDIAASIACSDISEWHGLNIEHGEVLYLCGEGYNGLTKRFMGWAQYHGVDRNKMRLHVTRRPKYLNDDAVIEWIISEIKELATKDLKLIIVDTLSRHFGGNENDATDATKFLNNLAEIQEEFKCAALVTHHTGVSSDAKNRGRGSSAFKGAVDMELQVGSTGEGAEFYLTLSQTKNKDDELQEPMTFKRESVPLEGIFDKNGKQVYTAVLKRMDAPAQLTNDKIKLTPTEKRAIETYIKAAQIAGVFTDGGDKFYGVRSECWREEIYKRSSSDNDSTKRGDVRRAKQALVENLGILISETDAHNPNGDIYKPDGKFSEYIEAAGLQAEFEQIKLTSRGEVI